MKLIFCKECCSIFSLSKNKKVCDCGKSSGFYKQDGLNAEFQGPAVPIGFANSSFRNALKNQPTYGQGQEFIAFVIPENCKTLNHKNNFSKS